MDEDIHRVLLAEDDPDDRIFFQEALEELPLTSSLEMVTNGIELMELLTGESYQLPGVLFLDLNMPLKTGIECLSDIKNRPRLKSLPVIILSTSLIPEVVNTLYDKGAHYYLRKPAEFSKLKQAIYHAISLVSVNKKIPDKENFLLNYK